MFWYIKGKVGEVQAGSIEREDIYLPVDSEQLG